MPNPRPLTESELQSLWAEVRAEFPDDEMMQEIHFVRGCMRSNSRTSLARNDVRISIVLCLGPHPRRRKQGSKAVR